MSEKEDLAKRDKEIIDVTFRSTPFSRSPGWGWRIPHNPDRGDPGTFTDAEREVTRMEAEATAQERTVTRTVTYNYCAPFNYPNVKVELGRPGTGVEFNPDGAEIDVYPYGAITIAENKPIVAVTVIGSGCSGTAYVVLEAEPLEWKYPRTAVRMMKRDLWGMHLRIDAWKGGVREDWNDAGLSSSRFDIPESKKVIVGGGSLGADPHYCIRIIRVDVAE